MFCGQGKVLVKGKVGHGSFLLDFRSVPFMPGWHECKKVLRNNTCIQGLTTTNPHRLSVLKWDQDVSYLLAGHTIQYSICPMSSVLWSHVLQSGTWFQQLWEQHLLLF